MCSRLAYEKHARAEAVARLEQLKSRRDALAAIAAQRSGFLCCLQVRCSGCCLPVDLSKMSFIGVANTSSTGAVAYPIRHVKQIKQLACAVLHAAWARLIRTALIAAQQHLPVKAAPGIIQAGKVMQTSKQQERCSAFKRRCRDAPASLRSMSAFIHMYFE